MLSYNIAVFCDIPNTLEALKRGLDYSMGVNYLRALNRINEHNIIHINHREIYKLNGPKKAMQIINDSLHKNRVDIVIFPFDDKFEFPIEFFSGLKNSYFMFMVTGDDLHFHEKSSKYYSQAFDLVMTHDLLWSKKYELYGIDAIPQPKTYDVSSLPSHKYEKVYDVSFVGVVQNKVGRIGFLRHLVDNNINMKVAGSGTTEGVVSREEMHRIYGSSKIALSFTGGSVSSVLDMDITINRRIRVPKGREHEIAMLGTFVLVEYCPGIEEFFDVGSEIDVFRNKDELLSKIKYYLKNDVLREQMASRAYERAIRECDEIKAWEKSLEIIDKKFKLKNSGVLTSEMAVYKDPIFLRAFSSFHLYKMLELLLKGKLVKAFEEFLIFVKYPFFDGGVFLEYLKLGIYKFIASQPRLRNVLQQIKNIVVKSHDAKI